MKILIVSNDLMTKNNNNGKVIANYFSAFSKNEICQFYLTGESDANCDFEMFSVTDKAALISFLTLGIKKNTQVSDVGSQSNGGKAIKNKNAFKALIRFCVWNSGLWISKKFKNWLIQQKIDCVFLMVGDNPYLMKLSMKISKKIGCKIILQIGEDYPLKEYDYFNRKLHPSLSYRLFHSLLFRLTKKIIDRSSLILFNSNYIKEDYLKFFKINNSLVLPQASSFNKKPLRNNALNIVYAGNLGLGRLDALNTFAHILNKEKPDVKIDVYSNIVLSNETRKAISPNIVFHGYLSNEELEKEIANSFALLHIEKNDDYNKLDLKNAFSTKIADMICSNKRIILFAPKELAESKYFMENLPKNYASSEGELPSLLSYIYSPSYSFDEQNKLSLIHNSNTVSSSFRELLIKNGNL